MAKTLANIIADWRQHIGQTEAANSQFSDTQGTIWANDAYRDIVSVLRHLPIKERDYSLSSYSSTVPITLNAETVTVDDALLKNPDSLNSDGSAKYEELEVLRFDELIAKDPNFRSAPTGMPTHLVRTGTFKAILWPPPKASVIAQTTPLQTHGLEIPSELSDDGDTMDIPSNLHHLPGHWMAYRSFAQNENTVKATEHLTLYRSGLKERKGLATEFSRKKKGWTYGPGIQ